MLDSVRREVYSWARAQKALLGLQRAAAELAVNFCSVRACAGSLPPVRCRWDAERPPRSAALHGHGGARGCWDTVAVQLSSTGGLGCTRGPRSVVLSTHNAPTTTQKESPLGTATAVAHHDRRARHIALCPDLRRDVSCGGGDRGRHAESSPVIMAYAP